METMSKQEITWLKIFAADPKIHTNKLPISTMRRLEKRGYVMTDHLAGRGRPSFLLTRDGAKKAGELK